MSADKNLFLIKRTSVPDRLPQLSSLEFGEPGANIADGKLFLKTLKNSATGISVFLSDDQYPYTLDTHLSSVNFKYGGNTTTQVFASVLNGYRNDVSGGGSTVTNGEDNDIAGDFCFIGSGLNNKISATGDYSSILGGQNNLITHNNCFVFGSHLSSHADDFTYVNNISGVFYGDGSNLKNIVIYDTTKLPLSGGTLTGKLYGNDADFSNSVYATTVSAVDFIGNGSLLTGVAKLNSPVFVGIPTAPTAPANTNSSQLATTQFVIENSGDRYLTTSSTSLTLNNNNGVSLTANAGLSYVTTQDISIVHSPTQYMLATVVSYNKATGVMVFDSNSHTGAGTFSSWTINVGGVPAAGSLISSNNLSDVASPSAALANLGGFPAYGGTLTDGLTGTRAQFNSVTYTPNASNLPYELGKVWYDTNKDALCYYNSVSSNIVHIGQEIQQYVRNATADTIKKGDVVVIRGFTNQSPDVVLALATSLSGSIITGVANQDIPANTNGYIVTIGEVANFDTSRFTIGDDLFLSPLSAGKLTNVLPTNPYFAVQVGVCIYSHATNGKLLVYTQYLGTAANTIIGTLGLEQLSTSVGSTVNTVSSLSSRWESVYTTVNSSSSSWVIEGDSTKLPLSGGIMTGPINFGYSYGPRIDQGRYDASRGGIYGISLVCSVDYDLNWQAGWITSLQQDRVTPMPLYIDSGAGTSLRIWNGAYVGSGSGVEISHIGVTFPDNTVQSTAALSLSGGTVTGDLTVTGTFSTVNTDSWTSAYTNVSSNSGRWKSVYTTVNSTSSDWNSVYSTYNTNSATYPTLTYVNQGFLPLSGGILNGNLNLYSNLNIFGNLSATGITTFRNTVFTTTSALSVYNIGPNPSLVVSQNGTGDIASFYDSDQNLEILHVGGQNSSFPNVGIKISNPNKDFTVNGEISANNTIWDSIGNSNQWNNVYSNVLANSSTYVTLTATQTIKNKTVIDWMTLVRGYNTTPTLLATTGSGTVYTYIYNSSPSNITYYRYIATDGSIDSFYTSWNGNNVSGLIASKSITI
jgi:hypothetical protein